jgi:hypothetical protein
MSFQTVVASQEEARPAEPGSGHRTKHSAQTNPKHQTGVLRRSSITLAGRDSTCGAAPSQLGAATAPVLPSALHSPRPRFRRRLRRMGWQQYSRIWGLSRDYPYILYRKQLTAGMRGWATGFPQATWPFLLVPAGSGAWESSAGRLERRADVSRDKAARGIPMVT